MGSLLPLPVREPVEERVQRGDPSIAYQGHVVANGSRGLLGHFIANLVDTVLALLLTPSTVPEASEAGTTLYLTP